MMFIAIFGLCLNSCSFTLEVNKCICRKVSPKHPIMFYHVHICVDVLVSNTMM